MASSSLQRPTIKPPDILQPAINASVVNLNKNSTNEGIATDSENSKPYNEAPKLLLKPQLTKNNMPFGNVQNHNSDDQILLTSKNIPTPIPTTKSVKEKENIKVQELKLNGFVGFDSLPYQIVNFCQSKG